MSFKIKGRFVITACVLILLFVLAAPYGARESGAAGEEAQIIPLDRIEPGMTGYGLSVWKGSRIERFEVEVIDVVPKFTNDQPIILVECKGQDLEKTRIIAGMSGSPIYIEGKLAGALAYGWAFAQEPVAGITPIEYMLEIKDRGMPQLSGLAGLDDYLSNAEKSGPRHSRPLPIATPLITSGFSRQGMKDLEELFEPLNIVPVAGGGLGSAELDNTAAAAIEPGSAVGAALMLGDLSMVGTGTVSYRRGNRLLAFGHPFLRGGDVSMPMTASKIHTVISTQEISFKLASPQSVIGEVIYDHQAAISGEIGKAPPMIPLDVSIRNPDTGFSKDYSMKMADTPALVPTLIKIGLQDIIRSAVPNLEPTTVRARSRIKLNGYGEAEFENLYAVRQRNFTMGYLEPVLFLSRNPFAEVEMEAVEMDLTIDNDLKIAAIQSVRTNTDEVEAGSTVEVVVTVKPYNVPPRDYRFQVGVPDHAGLKKLILTVAGGSRTPPDAAPPHSVEDMISFMDKVYSADSLVVYYKVPGAGVDVEGRRLDNLPPSAISMLQPSNAQASAMTGEKMYYDTKTPYVVLGTQRLKLNVVDREKKKRR